MFANTADNVIVLLSLHDSQVETELRIRCIPACVTNNRVAQHNVQRSHCVSRTFFCLAMSFIAELLFKTASILVTAVKRHGVAKSAFLSTDLKQSMQLLLSHLLTK